MSAEIFQVASQKHMGLLCTETIRLLGGSVIGPTTKKLATSGLNISPTRINRFYTLSFWVYT